MYIMVSILCVYILYILVLARYKYTYIFNESKINAEISLPRCSGHPSRKSKGTEPMNRNRKSQYSPCSKPSVSNR